MKTAELVKKDNSTVTKEVPKLYLKPYADIYESEDGFKLVLDIPGGNAENLNIKIHEGLMNIEAETPLKRQGRQVVYRRAFRISSDLDSKKICAAVKDGILTVNLPKPESAKPVSIKVKSA